MEQTTEKMTTKQLHLVVDQELVSMLTAKSNEYRQLVLKHAMRQLKGTHQLGVLKRQIARLKTVIRAKELAQTSV